jgi:hypothetical protein
MLGLTVAIAILVALWIYNDRHQRKDRERRMRAMSGGPELTRFERALAAHRAAPDEPDAIDGEKVARLGIQRDPALFYTIEDGRVWAHPRDGSPASPVTSTTIPTNIRFLYYLDADGDIARRRKSLS